MYDTYRFARGLAEGQRARFAREAATRFYPPPTPSGAVGHNPKSGSGQFLDRTCLLYTSDAADE